MDEVGTDIVEQTLVVGDDDGGVVGALELVDAAGHYAKGVDVESGVRLVEDGEARFEHGHLEYFVALFLAAGEAFVDRARGELVVEFYDGALLTHQLEELAGREGGLMEILALGIDGRAHEVDHRDSGNLNGILEGEEKTLMGAVLGREREQVEAVEVDGASCDGEGGITGENAGECGLSRAVGAHDCVNFAGADGKVDATEDLAPFNAGAQAADFQQYFVSHFYSAMLKRPFMRPDNSTMASKLQQIIETAVLNVPKFGLTRAALREFVYICRWLNLSK